MANPIKKIGIDARIFGTQHGGIGRYVQKFLPKVLEIDKLNQYFVFYNSKAVNYEELAVFKNFLNVTMVETKIRHYSLTEQTNFYRTLNKYALDLVHFPNFNVPVLYKKPFVVTIHDMVHHKIGGAKKSHWLHFQAYKKIIELAAKNSQAIITVSEHSKKDILDLLKAPAEKIHVIYEGVSLNPNVDQNRTEEVKKRYLLNKPYLLFVGVLERKKNIINLCRGFDLLLKKYHPNIDLVIVGKADKHYPEIKHKASDIKFSDHLVFTGYVEDTELEAL